MEPDDFEVPPKEPRGIPGSAAQGIPEVDGPKDDTVYVDPLEAE